VIVSDVDLKAATSLSEKINAQHSKAVTYPEYMNVIDKPSIEDVAARYPEVDVLINNAAQDNKAQSADGLNSRVFRFETMSLEVWKKSMEVCLDGSFLCSQVFGKKMIENKRGAIINVASDLAVIAPDQRIYIEEGVPSHLQKVKPVSYSVSKWGLLGLTKYLATYLAPYNIRVNSISPGGIYNEKLPSSFVDSVTNLIPLKRMAQLDEYAGAIVFLSSDASVYMTGHNLIMDGGRSIW